MEARDCEMRLTDTAVMQSGSLHKSIAAKSCQTYHSLEPRNNGSAYIFILITSKLIYSLFNNSDHLQTLINNSKHGQAQNSSEDLVSTVFLQ